MGIDSTRREWLVRVGTTAALGSVAGCTSGNGSDDGGSGGGNDDATLRWASTVTGGPQKEVEEAIAAEFEEETGHKVEFLRWPNNEYETQLQNAMGTKNAPDIADNGAGPGELGVLVDSNRYVPLGDYVPEDTLSHLVQSSLDFARFKGGNLLNWTQGDLYAVPIEMAGIMVWYNKAVLEDAGVDHKSLQHQTDMTWEEFVQVCETVKQAGSQPIVLGNRNQWPGAHWVAAFMTKAVGGQTFIDTAYQRGDTKFTDERFVTALERLQSLYTDGYLNDSVNAISNSEAASLFFNGKAAFYHQGAWMPGTVESTAPEGFGGIGDEIDFMWWPYHPDLNEGAKNERLTFMGDAYAISARAEKRNQAELAGKLIQKITSKEGLSKFLLDASVVVPSTEVWEENEAELNTANKTLKASIDDMAEADMLPPLFDVGFLPKPAEFFLTAGQELIADDKEPAEALSQLQTQTEKAINERQG